MSNYYDADNLLNGAAMIYIVATNIATMPDKVIQDEIINPVLEHEAITGFNNLKEYLEVWSQTLIKGLIESGFDHQEVKDRANEILEELKQIHEDTVAKGILDQLDEPEN